MPILKNLLFLSNRKKLPLSALCALPSAAVLWLYREGAFVAVPALWLFCTVLYMYFFSFSHRPVKAVAALTAFFFSLCCALSFYAVNADSAVPFYRVALVFMGCFFFFLPLLSALLRLSCRLSLMLPEESVRDTGKKRLFLIFAAVFAILFLWFCLWLLYQFPGCLSPDSTWQLLQARGEYPLSNHHPIAHTMIIRACVLFGFRFSGGNPSVALAVYSLVQAFMLALCFAWLIVSLYKMRVKRGAILTVFSSLILLPYHGEMGVTMVKDVWFAASMLLMSLSLWRSILRTEQGERPAPLDVVLLFLSAAGMCLFRSNGYYAFIVALPFLFAAFFRKSRAISAVLLLALALSSFIKGPYYDSLGIIQPDTIESLSIPAQHIARVIADGHELSDEQYELLSHALDVEQIEQAYVEYLADPIKDLVRYTGDQSYIASHRGEYLRLWLQLGMEHPLSYLKAHIGLTRGYWYPRTDGLVMYDYFTFSDTGDRVCLLPDALENLLSSMSQYMPKLPLVKYFFSNGAAVWLCLLLFSVCVVKKDWSGLVLFVPFLAVWASLLIATPLDNEFRYMYFLYLGLAPLCIVPFSHVNYHKDKVPPL